MVVTVHMGSGGIWDLELNECKIQDSYVKMLTHAVSFADTDSYKQVWIISISLYCGIINHAKYRYGWLCHCGVIESLESLECVINRYRYS